MHSPFLYLVYFFGVLSLTAAVNLIWRKSHTLVRSQPNTKEPSFIGDEVPDKSLTSSVDKAWSEQDAYRHKTMLFSGALVVCGVLLILFGVGVLHKHSLEMPGLKLNNATPGVLLIAMGGMLWSGAHPKHDK